MAEPSVEAQALNLLDRAMEQPEAEREAWITGRRVKAAVRDRALALLRGSVDAARMFNTGGAPARAGEAPLPERIGAYRITGLIGQGGMGAVYRGERAGDFDHTVAIKVIRPGALSGALIERFRRERQTLARLAHPNIAQLFDGGETEAGEPYIVMEFVDGRRLDVWLADEAPGLAVRLELFLAVAAAVAFAHQNLVVHGDVTPSNVLVDGDGRPKLIDFGIARPADETLADTPSRPRSSARSLTPGFAAPERLAGHAATTLSDIYSLGRVLERVVEGHADDTELAAIVARATAEDPARRYSTVEELRRDLTAHLRGFPVAAVAGGRGYVFGKFVGRHRLAVSGSVAAAALIVVSLVVTLAANSRAETARAEAERRFQQTRAIATTMLFDVYNEVSKVQGSTKARDVLARTGLKYLDALTADPKAPLDVRVEAGRGYVRLAQVTGSGQQSQLGKTADANTLLAKAEAVLKRAYAEAPEDPKVRRALADLLIEQAGVNLYSNSEIALARKQTIEVQRLLEPFARTDAEAARIYATAIQAEGDSYGWDGEYQKSLEPFARAEAFITALPPALRDETGVMKAHSAILRLTAEAHHELQDDKAALRPMDQAVAINEELVRREAQSPEVVRKLAISLWYRAVVLDALGRDAEAYASVDRAVGITRQMRARDAADKGATNLFAIVGEVRATILADLRRFPESYAMADEVVTAHRQIVGQSDNAPGPRRAMAETLKNLGVAYYKGGQHARACATWDEARGALLDLARAGKLTGHDRDNALKDLDGWMSEGCDPPRPGVKALV